MTKQPRIHSKWMLFFDACIFVGCWIVFYYCRSLIYDYPFKIPPGFFKGLICFTFSWIALFYVVGTYRSIYYRSRITEVFYTTTSTLSGSLILLFVFILKNPHENNHTYYLEFISILLPTLFGILLIRMIFLNLAKKQILNGEVYFPTILIGNLREVTNFYSEFSKIPDNRTHRILGFIPLNEEISSNKNDLVIPSYKMADLENLMESHGIEEIIVVPNKENRSLLSEVLKQIVHLNISIKITPDDVDILAGYLKTQNVLATPLIEVHPSNMPAWQQHVKRLIDIFFSISLLVLFIPFFIYLAIRVKLSSPGSIVYRQKRIGLKGKSFTMYKFRSMYADAEANGPQLSSADDTRITQWGKIMRKWRLDETPQLWNVLKGEMSLVGPRPERKYYIDQLIAAHPEYRYIFKVKPGISSWGMVKFGYASNIEEMLKRMPYDLLYVENASLLLDAKILVYTLQLILSGKGK
jgi:exopolysaccharide biosynthesis polyprenyl glycosylphosphotransferase